MYKIMVVGDGLVGKTCLLNRFAFGEIPNGYEPTVFENFAFTVTVKGEPHHVELWDTAGQEDYDRLRKLLYSQADAFIVCFAIDDSNSYRHARYKYILEIREVKPKCPIVLAGTKADLRREDIEVMSRQMGEILKKQIKAVAYIETSAFDNFGVVETFEEAVKALVAKKGKKCSIL